MSIKNRRSCGIGRQQSRFFRGFAASIGDRRLRRKPLVTDRDGCGARGLREVNVALRRAVR